MHIQSQRYGPGVHASQTLGQDAIERVSTLVLLRRTCVWVGWTSCDDDLLARCADGMGMYL
jgi:hypothetical protein